MQIGAGVAGVLCGLALAVSACGGDGGALPAASTAGTSASSTSPSSSPTAGATGPLDVCALLTPADLQQAFGSPFGAGEGNHQDQTGADQCVWTNTDVPPVGTFSVTVLRQGAIAGALANSGLGVKELHASARAALGGVTEVDLGDDAYLSGSTLAVLKGDTEYTFSSAFGGSAAAVRGLEALAAKVVG